MSGGKNRTDELWPGGPRFLKGGAFSLGTDSVLLADFASGAGAKRVCDLGCGSGILSVLVAWNDPAVTLVDGVEIQKQAAAAASVNVEMNRLSSRVRITAGDLREYRELFDAGDYDMVVSNPPYFPSGSGYASEDEAAAVARDERSCTLADVCGAAAYLTRWGGRFCLVHRPERLSEVFCALTAAGLEPKRLRLVQHRADAAPNLALIEARRGGRPGLEIKAPLLMTDETGGDSPEIRRIYHRSEQ